MEGNLCFEEVGLDLLGELELILERDNSIDEVGFLHPAQFVSLTECSGTSLTEVANQSPDGIPCKGKEELKAVQYENTALWSSNHKLAISVQVLPQLYRAAMQAYMDVSRRYKQTIRSPTDINLFGCASNRADLKQFLETEILKHTRPLLILSYDFNSGWNSRKLVLSRKHELSLFIKELQLCALILSHAPKSESTWRHRQWVIKMFAEKFQNMQEIIEKESELVQKIAEKSKMNYRAWNHRCWLVLYMTWSQVLDELNNSRKWAELHVADNSCFHYRRRLMLRMLEGNFLKQAEEASFSYNSEVYIVWKEELQWNKLLIKLYIGREALWIHRRFLSQYWIKHFTMKDIDSILDDFLGEELQLLHACLNMPPDEFDDSLAQAQHAASYILYILKQNDLLREDERHKRLTEVARDLKAKLTETCPKKLPLWEKLLDGTSDAECCI